MNVITDNLKDRSITLGEYKALQNGNEEYHILGSVQEDDDFIAEYGLWEYHRLYDDGEVY